MKNFEIIVNKTIHCILYHRNELDELQSREFYFDNLRECAKELNLPVTLIYKAIKGETPINDKNYIVCYYNPKKYIFIDKDKNCEQYFHFMKDMVENTGISHSVLLRKCVSNQKI